MPSSAGAERRRARCDQPRRLVTKSPGPRAVLFLNLVYRHPSRLLSGHRSERSDRIDDATEAALVDPGEFRNIIELMAAVEKAAPDVREQGSPPR
jgi:hypothetical protein